MEKKFLVIKKPGQKDVDTAFFNKDWDVEVLELEEGEPLPKSFENISGLLVLGNHLNLYEPSTNPCLEVYFN